MLPVLRPACVPGGDPARVFVRTIGAVGALRAWLSVQEEAAGAPGIVRGRGPAFVPVLRDGRLVRATEQSEQRRGFLPVIAPDGGDAHVARFAARFPDRAALAVVGAGNVLANPGVFAATPAGRFGVPGVSGPSFALDDGCSLTGPALVVDGRAVDPDPATYADLRHLLLPAWVEVRPGVRVDFGLDRLLADPAALRDAVAGRRISLPLVERLPATDDVDAALVDAPVDPARLAAAFAAKGYRESAAPNERGTYRIRGGEVEVVFAEGVYPHHAFARDADGRPWSILVAGRSNREGTTVRALAAALVAAGARQAILSDNGGDVGLLRRADARAPWSFEIRPAEADRAATWPLRACAVYWAPR